MTGLQTCPRCGEEYLASVATCADCGIPLGTGEPAPEPEPADLPPSAELVALRHAEVTWIEGLAEALAAAGIPSRVELPSERDDRSVQGRGMGSFRCTLFVRSEDAAAAARVDADFARTQVPDLPEEIDPGSTAEDACPGCGTPVVADAEECPECGLAFGREG
jgi:hypothetical protein